MSLKKAQSKKTKKQDLVVDPIYYILALGLFLRSLAINQSFWLDFKILILTIGKVFRREGISAEGEATMSFFYGTKD